MFYFVINISLFLNQYTNHKYIIENTFYFNLLKLYNDNLRLLVVNNVVKIIILQVLLNNNSHNINHDKMQLIII